MHVQFVGKRIPDTFSGHNSVSCRQAGVNQLVKREPRFCNLLIKSLLGGVFWAPAGRWSI